MAIKYKDYYEVLGLPRDASQDAVKQAYRTLARKYHPDVSGGRPGAEDRFKEINEAYEVLKDPGKRRKYDSLGHAMEHEGEFRPPPEWGETAGWRTMGGQPEGFGFNFGGTGFSDFFEAYFGSRRMGADPFAAQHRGMDFRRAGPIKGEDLEADIMVTLEEAIHGSTRQVKVNRGSLGDRGGVESYQVKIPPGVRQGQRIRLTGKGEAGTEPGAPPGDLYLRVRLSEHPFFRVEGDDIIHDVELAPWEAALGAWVAVPTPAGKASLRVPPGTSTGRRFRLRQQGLPKGGGERGDLYVVATVRTPPHLTPQEKSLWEELRRVSDFNPRR